MFALINLYKVYNGEQLGLPQRIGNYNHIITFYIIYSINILFTVILF